MMTAGDDVAHIARFLKPGCDSYTAADVVARLLGVSDESLEASTPMECDEALSAVPLQPEPVVEVAV